MNYNFYATVSRMKYIARWALMRNTREENLSEHSLEVSMIAHALCIIGNERYNKQLDADYAALVGIYHDASEIITGDMPTPIKYYNRSINEAFKSIEDEANRKLLEQLPEDIRKHYQKYFFKPADREYEWRLVKAADKISALIKCLEEEKTGNREFVVAKSSTEKTVAKLGKELPEVKDFINECLDAFSKTLDELG
ncbi:MAG: 5'-deoxynucleotidase [Lachnospiraceae bacterium]|nr:5'-deoxynucleotidase [Lachnospiraceae bacterium]